MPHRRAARWTLDHRSLIAYLIIVSAMFFGLIRLEVVARHAHELSIRIESVASNHHVALCAFRRDLALRARSAAKALTDSKGQDPVNWFGLRIPRSVLVTNYTNQKRTLDSLKALDCSDNPMS